MQVKQAIIRLNSRSLIALYFRVIPIYDVVLTWFWWRLGIVVEFGLDFLYLQSDVELCCPTVRLNCIDSSTCYSSPFIVPETQRLT